MGRIPNEFRQNFRRIVKQDGWPLYIFGPTGSGKTCIAALLYATANPNIHAEWFVARNLLRQLAACRADSTATVDGLGTDGKTIQLDEQRAWKRLKTSQLVVLDEVIVRALSDAQAEIMLEILDARRGMETVLTGNLDEEQMSEVVDARIVSRIFQGSAIYLDGEDLRSKGKVVHSVSAK